MKAELVLKNGNVITVDAKNSRHEAIAVQNQKILKVGSNKEISGLVDDTTKVIDLAGKTVVPGFIDPHQHLMSYGITEKTWIDLAGTSNYQDIPARIAEQIKRYPKGHWVLGRGWNEETSKGLRLPNRWELDEVSPDNPIALRDISGHYGLANSKALQIGGVAKDTPQPKDGWIDKDSKSGEPTGILREGAQKFVWSASPPLTYEEIVEAVELGVKKANSIGLTSVHTVGIPLPRVFGYTAEELRAFVDLNIQKKLTVRAYLLIPVNQRSKAVDTIMLDHLIGVGLKTGFGDAMLKIGPAKIFVDGSLNARSAALYDPYSDDLSTSGIMFYTQKELDDVVSKAHRAGFQIAIHAHGDRAIDVSLNSYEKALKELPRENHRHRIKHVELLKDEQIERIKKLGLIVTGIPTPAGFSPWFQELARVRVGDERAKYLHRYKEVMESGTLVVGGTDGHPVGKYLSPLQGLRDRVKVAGFTLEQALAIQTKNSAYASFEEDAKGTIERGKYADFTILSEDPFAIDVENIPNIRVEKTIVGGEIVFENSSGQKARKKLD